MKIETVKAEPLIQITLTHSEARAILSVTGNTSVSQRENIAILDRHYSDYKQYKKFLNNNNDIFSDLFWKLKDQLEA